MKAHRLVILDTAGVEARGVTLDVHTIPPSVLVHLGCSRSCLQMEARSFRFGDWLWCNGSPQHSIYRSMLLSMTSWYQMLAVSHTSRGWGRAGGYLLIWVKLRDSASLPLSLAVYGLCLQLVWGIQNSLFLLSLSVLRHLSFSLLRATPGLIGVGIEL